MIKLMIVDTPGWIDTIRQSLDANQHKIIWKTSNVNVYPDKYNTDLIDLILLDYNLIRDQAISYIKQLKENIPGAKIILMNMTGIDVMPLIQAGIAGFSLKPHISEELPAAIQTIMDGDPFFSPTIVPSLLKKVLRLETMSATHSAKGIEISERQREVLQLVLKEKSNIEIAETLNISRRTVEAHKRNLILKTNSKNLVGLVIYSIKNNLIES